MTLLGSEALKKYLAKKSILVTGGLGSIGSEIVEGLLRYDVRLVRVFDNRETEIFHALRKKTDDRVDYFFGDVRDKEALRLAMRDVDIVFHAAAMKHVIIAERHPAEAVKTNVIGTQNIIDLCLEYDIEKMILISTDKAVNPEGVMGTTKLLAERMIAAMHSAQMGQKTKFGAVRFGNVMYSRGSVLEIWEQQTQAGEKITITNQKMTRFLMSIPQSVQLILAATLSIENGEVFIMKMPSCSIETLATAYLKAKDMPPDAFRVIGMNKGDKFHEKLFSDDESAFLLENESFFVKLPLEIDKINEVNQKHYRDLGFREVKSTDFSSNCSDFLMDADQTTKILQNFIKKNDNLFV